MSEFDVFAGADIQYVSGYVDPAEDADSAAAAAMLADDRLTDTVAERLPTAEYVATKVACGARAAICRHPTGVRPETRMASRAAAADPRATAGMPVPMRSPVRVSVAFTNAELADVATLRSGVERGADSRTVVREATGVPAVYRLVHATTTPSP